jgi:hypothetical protein
VRVLSCMAKVRFLFDSLLMCMGVCALFLKSSDNAPCIIYIFMHITRLDMGLQNHARVVGALCCFLCGFILCVIFAVLFSWYLQGAVFFCALANYVIIIYDYRDPNPLLG